MAVTLTLPVIFFGSHFPPSSSRSRSRSKTFSCCSSASSSQMELNNEFGVTKFKEFPYVSAPHRNLMVDLVSTVENRLGSQLLPCTLPPDVQYYQNQTGSAHASLHARSGNKPSQSQGNSFTIIVHHRSLTIGVNNIYRSWIHCELPTGGALNITSLSAFLNPLTDAPNFLIELIQSSPTSLILILDLPPRKDLVLCPDYLHTFYEETQLDTRKQRLEKIPEVKPYISSSLYIRSVVSPTAIMVRIETQASQPGRVEEVIKDHVDPIAKEVLGIWLDQCACGKREVGEAERAILEKRDGLIKIKTIEVDLGSNFPRLFGPEVANRVLGAIRDVYTV